MSKKEGHIVTALYNYSNLKGTWPSCYFCIQDRHFATNKNGKKFNNLIFLTTFMLKIKHFQKERYVMPNPIILLFKEFTFVCGGTLCLPNMMFHVTLHISLVQLVIRTICCNIPGLF